MTIWLSVITLTDNIIWDITWIRTRTLSLTPTSSHLAYFTLYSASVYRSWRNVLMTRLLTDVNGNGWSQSSGRGLADVSLVRSLSMKCWLRNKLDIVLKPAGLSPKGMTLWQGRNNVLSCHGLLRTCQQILRQRRDIFTCHCFDHFPPDSRTVFSV